MYSCLISSYRSLALSKTTKSISLKNCVNVNIINNFTTYVESIQALNIFRYFKSIQLIKSQIKKTARETMERDESLYFVARSIYIYIYI